MTDTQSRELQAIYDEVSNARRARTLTKDRFDQLFERARLIVGQETYELEGLLRVSLELGFDTT